MESDSLKVQSDEPIGPQYVGAPTQAVHGPRYYRKLWSSVLQEFYGNEEKALDWMTNHWPPFSEIPLKLVQTAEGRNRVLAEVNRLAALRFAAKPRTAWKTYLALAPSEHNGELLFRGTQIPAAFLFSALARGTTIKGFIRKYPEVTRKHVDMVLNQIYQDLCDF